MTGTSDGPRQGDALLRGDAIQGFNVVDAISLQPIAGRIFSREAAMDVARLYGGAVWHQTVDNRGRPLGDPIRLLWRPEGDRLHK